MPAHTRHEALLLVLFRALTPLQRNAVINLAAALVGTPQDPRGSGHRASPAHATARGPVNGH